MMFTQGKLLLRVWAMRVVYVSMCVCGAAVLSKITAVEKREAAFGY